jgi:hypothetical protein
MVRQKRTDGRLAFENIPTAIRPSGSFEIRVVDEQDNPLNRLRFSVSVDGGEEKAAETDGDGIMKVRKPQSELKIKLTDA